jgi:phosphotransferase system enzyme I (PtsI)
MQIKKGIPVSPGVAIQRATVLDAEDQPVPRRIVAPGQVERELERLHDALAQSVKDIEKLRAQTAQTLGDELAQIFGFHLAMLHDKSLLGQIRQLIEDDHVTAEFAVFTVMHKTARMFTQMDDRVFRERVSDVWDLERRVLRHLMGESQSQLKKLTTQAVLIAHDLTPSQTASLDRKKIKGMATELGGRTSHTAILAHALGIPAIVGVEGLSAAVTAGDTIIIDGNEGVVVIDPDAAKLMEYRQRIRRMAVFEEGLGELAGLPAVTKDGTPIVLQANIEFPTEIAKALDKGATGIGLYRTEFLYLASDIEPDEKKQYEAYATALKNLRGRPLTIRTLDLGADKLLPNSSQQPSALERNPFLGCRSIRLCLQNLPLFQTQLRAILRASVHGPIRIMFPLISNIMELRQARMILHDVMEDLDDQGVEFRRDLPIGIMIEVPSAALQVRTYCREVDFFSIGTNDLVQYTVAVDRGNERIASLYSASHPAVIALIRDVVRSAARAKKECSLCGEMGGQPEYAMLLLGLGLRSFSITPPAIPEIKKIIRSVSIDQCQRVARKVATFDSDREVTNYLREEIKRVIPEAYDGRSIDY